MGAILGKGGRACTEFGYIEMTDFQETKMKLSQVILDLVNMNLNKRVNLSDPDLPKF